jgi:cold shock CspA family protein
MASTGGRLGHHRSTRQGGLDYMTTWQRPVRVDARGPHADGLITHLAHGRLCGRIRASDGLDVFFHGRDLNGVKYNDLEVGRRVRFELIDDPISGPRAAHIQLIVV